MTDSILEERAQQFAGQCGIMLDLQFPLGSGTDGSVWQTNRMTAVKALARQHNYKHELECYERFKAAGVSRVGRFAIPELIGYSEELWIIEMTLVAPPFIIDFAKVSLDHPPDYSPEVLADEEERNQDIFEERWPEVKSLLWALRQYGIYYMDPKPGNIMFEDWPLG